MSGRQRNRRGAGRAHVFASHSERRSYCEIGASLLFVISFETITRLIAMAGACSDERSHHLLCAAHATFVRALRTSGPQDGAAFSL